jgi:hypothetical protein
LPESLELFEDEFDEEFELEFDEEFELLLEDELLFEFDEEFELLLELLFEFELPLSSSSPGAQRLTLNRTICASGPFTRLPFRQYFPVLAAKAGPAVTMPPRAVAVMTAAVRMVLKLFMFISCVWLGQVWCLHLNNAGVRHLFQRNAIRRANTLQVPDGVTKSWIFAKRCADKNLRCQTAWGGRHSLHSTT